MSGPRRNEAHYFSENSPRPPVPGEEACGYIDRYRPQSPVSTPRRSSIINRRNDKTNDKLLAPMGFEPEGCCEKTTMERNSSPPACLQWARDLRILLKDEIGLQLFRKYLTQENIPDSPLIFWFSCEGLKETKDPTKIQHLIKIIWKRFIVKTQLPISQELKKDTHRKIREGKADIKIFDRLQLEVERIINDTTYPNFIRSDMYLQYVHDSQNNDLLDTSSSSSREMSLSCGATSLLPTLHEDSEFIDDCGGIMSQSACNTPGEFRLTQDILMKTQQTRAINLRPKPEAYAGVYLKSEASPYSPYHMSSSRLHTQYSYNPVSRQDSELQSLSSDARTESDNLSLNGSSVDGISLGRRSNKRQTIRHNRQMKESANLNRDVMSHHTVIPRTQRMPQDSTRSMEPQKFADLLYMRLEKVKADLEQQDKLARNLQDLESMDDDGAPKALADSLRIFEEDNDQAILDEHVSRIWSDPTPSRSPGASPPRSNNGNGNGGGGGNSQSPDRKYSISSTRSQKTRKDKDVYSTFSIDSGNIHDFNDLNDIACGGSVSSFSSNIPKSKSVPSEYADTLHKPDLYQSGHHHVSKQSVTKKSTTELTDSGVSVVSSDTRPAIPAKGYRASSWSNHHDVKTDIKHSRHVKKYGSRSGSLERPHRDWGVPAQPFAADPGMPLLPQPHTATQLEEARRRLEEDTRSRGGSSSSIVGSISVTSRRYPQIVKQQYESTLSQSQLPSVSNQSTLRKSRQDTGEFTRAVITVCDDTVPYLVKIPGNNITLKQFKEFVPKKGNHRYFFKTECEDPDVKVIQEEITDDADILPLWGGKIMAQVKALD